MNLKKNMKKMEMNDDKYYLGNCDCPPTVLTIQTGNITIKQELPWDVDGYDLCHAFYTAAIGITFDPVGILETMKSFAEERLPKEEIKEDKE